MKKYGSEDKRQLSNGYYAFEITTESPDVIYTVKSGRDIVTTDNFTNCYGTAVLPFMAAQAGEYEFMVQYNGSSIGISDVTLIEVSDNEIINFISGVADLPDAENVSQEDILAFNAVNSAFENFSRSQKQYVQREVLEKYLSVKKAIEDLHPFIPGDINGDGFVTASDALLALQYSVKKITLSSEQLIVADYDNNGSVAPVDALLILQKAVGKI